jgi:hypothetical protein
MTEIQDLSKREHHARVKLYLLLALVKLHLQLYTIDQQYTFP